jgi:Fe-S cluster assembly protein SufD
MNTVSQSTARYVADYDSIASQLPGSGLSWLQAMRTRALSQFSASGFPSPREEEWKYTNVAPIERKMFLPRRAIPGSVDIGLLGRYRLPDAFTLVFVDGGFDAGLSNFSGLPDGVVIAPLSEALGRFPELVRSRLGGCIESEPHGFISFNTAMFSDGVLVVLPARTVLERPIQLLHVATQPESLCTVRHLIVAENSAKGEIVESFVGQEDLSYLTASVCEVDIGENAAVTLHKFQAETAKAFHFGGIYVKQAQHGRFEHHNCSFGGLLVRSEIHVGLDQASECLLNGLFLGSGRQHVDNHTRVDHFKPYGISREVYKGILDERARGVFQGRMIVHQDAQKTDSNMTNRNLLLSVDAEIDTKPQLEIYADDVKCGHGVTVGQLEEELVFYLRSRGIDEPSARNMLTFAFANEMVEKIEYESLRSLVLEELISRLPQASAIKEWL